MRTFLSLIILLCCFVPGDAQKGILSKYAVDEINDSLRENASEVFRIDDLSLEMEDPSSYKETIHQVITIFNAEGARYLHLNYQYDKHNKIDDIEVKVYDKNGLEINKFKKKNFQSKDYISYSLADDYKILFFDVPYPGFPCTIEISKKETSTSYLNFPASYIASNTEQFRYAIKVPSDFDIHYKSINISEKPVITTEGRSRSFVWDIKNIKANRVEENGFRPIHYMSGIMAVPNFFIYEGFKGSLKTWKDFGDWNYPLYQEKNPFTSERMAQIRSLTDTCTSVRSKVNILYTYLKSNTRYVSVQLGIGGFKPFTSKFVDENKYGDCKALTNYMRNLLQVAGINSYPALVNAEYNDVPVDSQFPVQLFNHAILCIPNAKDTLWLECTSQDNPTGFLGTFTEDRYALLLTEKGGILVKTPQSNWRNNQLVTATDIFLKKDGSSNTQSHIYASGDIFTKLDNKNNLDKELKKEIVVNDLHFRSSENFAVQKLHDSALGVTCIIEQSFEKGYDFKAGSKFFFPLRINEMSSENLKPDVIRTIEYVFEYPYIKSDYTVYHLPDSYTIDHIPESVEWSNEYASYKRNCLLNKEANTISISSSLILKKRIISAKDYPVISQFFKDVLSDQGKNIILKND